MSCHSSMVILTRVDTMLAHRVLARCNALHSEFACAHRLQVHTHRSMTSAAAMHAPEANDLALSNCRWCAPSAHYTTLLQREHQYYKSRLQADTDSIPLSVLLHAEFAAG